MRKNFLSFLIVLSLALAGYLAMVPSVKAVNLKDAFNNMVSTTGERTGFNTTQRNVEPIIGNIISVILSFLGVIFLVLMVYGGYMWMTAMGSEEKVKKAQQLIQAAVIGLIVVVGAYAITAFVMARLTKQVITSDNTLIR